MINESSSTFEVLRAYLLARASISEEEMAAQNERIVSSISASAHNRFGADGRTAGQGAGGVSSD